KLTPFPYTTLFRSQFESLRPVSAMDLEKLSVENACHDQRASWSEPPHNAFRLLDQQLGGEVGADHVKSPAIAKRQADEVLSKDANPLRDPILKCIRPRHANGCRIEVKGLHRFVTELCRRNSKNSGAGA